MFSFVYSLTKENFCNERVHFYEKEKTRLEIELTTAIDNYKMMRENSSYRIDKLEKEISFYNEENNKLLNEINQVSPDYEDLCKRHDQKLKEFNRTKTDLFSKNLLLFKIIFKRFF
jgi:hypothetical protein